MLYQSACWSFCCLLVVLYVGLFCCLLINLSLYLPAPIFLSVCLLFYQMFYLSLCLYSLCFCLFYHSISNFFFFWLAWSDQSVQIFSCTANIFNFPQQKQLIVIINTFLISVNISYFNRSSHQSIYHLITTVISILVSFP